MATSSIIQVRKNNGDLVPFDPDKIAEALRRSGAAESDISTILPKVINASYDGITTRKIFNLAYGLLRKVSNQSAGRFKLKKALLELGTTGFPFEQFFARILESEGFNTRTGEIISGRCVQHEVDVLAEKPGKLIMAECKYHQSEGIKSDVKISLYVHSRFQDIGNRLREDPAFSRIDFQPMLITNTRFTEDAIQFAECSGLNLVSWDYPAGSCLKDRIDRSGFYPISVLKSLTKQEKNTLMDHGVILCRELAQNPDSFNLIQVPGKRMQQVVQEVEALIR